MNKYLLILLIIVGLILLMLVIKHFYFKGQKQKPVSTTLKDFIGHTNFKPTACSEGQKLDNNGNCIPK